MTTNKQLLYIFIPIFIFTLGLSYNKVSSQDLPPVLKGGITTVLQKGEVINVTLNTPINFYFSQSGDKVAFFTNEDIVIGENSYIPKGSRIEGTITNIKEPKGFGQNGAFEVSFNEIITPQNIFIPISATVSTDTQKSSEKAAEILSYDAALIAYGTFHGFVAGVQYGGIPLAIASHGISLLAGAGIGTGAGLIGSALRKGKIPTTFTGTGTPLVLKSDLYILGELPKRGDGPPNKVGRASPQRGGRWEMGRPIKLGEPRPKGAGDGKKEFKGFRFFSPPNKDEIKISILKIRNEHSKTFGNYLVLEVNIKNDSQKTISLTDIVLVNNKDSNLLHADLFLTGTKALQSIKPLEERDISLAFTTEEKIENYSIAIIDPLDGSEVVKVPLK